MYLGFETGSGLENKDEVYDALEVRTARELSLLLAFGLLDGNEKRTRKRSVGT